MPSSDPGLRAVHHVVKPAIERATLFQAIGLEHRSTAEEGRHGLQGVKGHLWVARPHILVYTQSKQTTPVSKQIEEGLACDSREKEHAALAMGDTGNDISNKSCKMQS